jgi:DNA-binding transcriptional regulator GbsR (MarR family)
MLGASKGSVSAMTRLLIQMNLVERVALPDQRRDYYRLRSGAWPQLIKSELAVMTGLHQMVERGLAMTTGRDAAYQERLREAHDLYAFLERELPMLLERWGHERKSTNSR